MVLQSFALPFNDDIKKEVWYQITGTIHHNANEIILEPGSSISSATYMNIFDIKTWRKNTTVENIKLICSVKGRGKISVLYKLENLDEILIEEKCFSSMDENEELIVESEQIHLSDYIEGFIYFVIESKTSCIVSKCTIESVTKSNKNIHLSIGICTYKRPSSLLPILDTLQDYIDNTEDKWIDVVVIDNASSINNQFGPYIQCIHNKNTGGSGGFTKAMEVIQMNHIEKQTTHVLLMDDDVILHIESIIRLRALLSFMKADKISEVIAGRMFCMDKMHIQYTAVERWNSGIPRHIGGNIDMSSMDNIFTMNDNRGAEYSGWWFACFPIDFILSNKPLPFFLHGDDAEYGLRHGGEPIILNGIQVWHETYEYRESPMISYYDVRNSLFVCQIHTKRIVVIRLLIICVLRSIKFMLTGQLNNAKMQLLGVLDYCKGLEWLESLDMEVYHKYIEGRTHYLFNIKMDSKYKNRK